jgi:hypothetical protein
MTPDSGLSPAERAALAALEAAASASDPVLAARLKGPRRPSTPPPVLLLYGWARRMAVALANAGWWGLPMAIAGVVLMVAGISQSLALSALGAAATTAGMLMLSQLLGDRRRGGRSTS